MLTLNPLRIISIELVVNLIAGLRSVGLIMALAKVLEIILADRQLQGRLQTLIKVQDLGLRGLWSRLQSQVIHHR